MRAFVTGGSAFLGRRLIAVLRGRGDGVRALARSDAAMSRGQRREGAPRAGYAGRMSREAGLAALAQGG